VLVETAPAISTSQIPQSMKNWKGGRIVYRLSRMTLYLRFPFFVSYAEEK
jgi:hypothetical protein